MGPAILGNSNLQTSLCAPAAGTENVQNFSLCPASTAVLCQELLAITALYGGQVHGVLQYTIPLNYG